MKFDTEKIRLLRAKKKISQKEMAGYIGISQTAYAKIESGKTESVSLKAAVEIAKALDANFVELYQISDEHEKNYTELLREYNDLLEKYNNIFSYFELFRSELERFQNKIEQFKSGKIDISEINPEIDLLTQTLTLYNMIKRLYGKDQV